MAKLSQEELEELQNPDSWEDAGTVRPAARSPRAVVSVAFSREDFEDVAGYAKLHGMKISELIRRAVLERVTPDQQRAVVLSVSGGVQTSYAAIVSPRPKVEIKAPQPEVLATA